MLERYKQKLIKIKMIGKLILNPKVIIWMVAMTLIPVGMALKWKEIKKIWDEKENQNQTNLYQWAESPKELKEPNNQIKKNQKK